MWSGEQYDLGNHETTFSPQPPPPQEPTYYYPDPGYYESDSMDPDQSDMASLEHSRPFATYNSPLAYSYQNPQILDAPAHSSTYSPPTPPGPDSGPSAYDPSVSSYYPHQMRDASHSTLLPPLATHSSGVVSSNSGRRKSKSDLETEEWIAATHLAQVQSQNQSHASGSNHNGEGSTVSYGASTPPAASPTRASSTSPHRARIMPYRSGVTPFASKLYFILEHVDEWGECIRWEDSGESFIIDIAHDRFLNEILPDMFLHSNIISFCRQLQIYGFQRLSTDDLHVEVAATDSSTPPSDWRAFSHNFMKAGDPSKLSQLRPRQSKARLSKKIKNLERRGSK